MKTFLTLVFIVSLLSGCSLKQAYPKKNNFMLPAANTLNVVTSNTTGCILQVNGASINPAFSGSEFIYQISNTKFINDYYNRFFNPPSEQITQVLLHNLSFPKCKVVSESALAHKNYLLQSNVIQLYGDFRNPPNSMLALNIMLYQATSKGLKLLLDKTYQQQTPIPVLSAKALLLGHEKGIQIMMKKMRKDLGKILVFAP